MGSLSIWHWLIVGAVVLIVFGGKGKISDVMGDFAKGIKAFKKGMQDEDETRASSGEPARTLEHAAPPPPPPPPRTPESTPDNRKVG